MIDEVCSTSVPAEAPAPAAMAPPSGGRGAEPASSQGRDEGEPLQEKSQEKSKRRRKKKKKKGEEAPPAPVPRSTDALAQPRLLSTAMLKQKLERLEAAAFDPSEALVDRCRQQAVRQAMASSNAAVPKKISALYNGLAPIVDRVPDRKSRKVGKQVDPKWAQSIRVRPKVEDCWRSEERVPQVCELAVKSCPQYGDLVEVHSRIAMM